MPQHNQQPDSSSSPPGGWQPCQCGTITECVQSGSLLTRRNLLIGSSSTVVLMAGLLATGWLSQSPAQQTLALGCVEVRARLRGYVAGTIGDRQMVESIRAHLAACNPCLAAMDQWL